MVGEGSLTNAVSLNSAAFTGARVIGPAIAGLVIAGARHDLVLRARRGVVPVRARGACSRCVRPSSTRSRGRRGSAATWSPACKYVWQTDELRRPLIVLAVDVHPRLQLAGADAAARRGVVQRGPEGVRPALGGRGDRLPRRRGDDRAWQPASRDGPARCVLAPRRRLDGAGRARADARARDAHDGAARLRGDVLHDHRQHDAAAQRQATGARPGDGAVRHRLPRLDPDRCADRRMARPGPRPARRVRADGRAGRRDRGRRAVDARSPRDRRRRSRRQRSPSRSTRPAPPRSRRANYPSRSRSTRQPGAPRALRTSITLPSSSASR